MTLIAVRSRYASIRAICSKVARAITSSFFDGSPATIPIAAATAMPRPPLEFGTVTLFTFFITFPLTSISTFSGTAPKVSRAFAAQKAMAIGSVQPIAGISSVLRIST